MTGTKVNLNQVPDVVVAAANRDINDQMLGIGWRDYIADFRVIGNAQPTWATFRSGIAGYAFSATQMREVFTQIHINHDYAPGTPLYVHAHWSQNTAAPSEFVRWGFEFSIAKGHGQQVFPPTDTVYVTQSCTAQYQHMVAEIAVGISSASIEVDSLVILRVFRDATNQEDTSPNTAFLFCIDAHYQCNRISTPRRAPDFYAEG